jgi:tetratricopeptide (TPR) repeat protein
VRRELAKALRKGGNIEAALDCLERLLDLDENYLPALVDYGAVVWHRSPCTSPTAVERVWGYVSILGSSRSVLSVGVVGPFFSFFAAVGGLERR